MLLERRQPPQCSPLLETDVPSLELTDFQEQGLQRLTLSLGQKTLFAEVTSQKHWGRVTVGVTDTSNDGHIL